MAIETKINPTETYTHSSKVGQRNWRLKIAELWHYRYLLYNLILRDLKARYKNSILGVLWSLLNPLGMMLVFTIVFRVLGNDSSRQYPVFILVGLIPWTFFNGSLFSGSTSIIGGSSLIKKVYFPRELLPLSALFSNLVNFFFALIVLVVFLYAYGLGLTWNALWVIPILFIQLLFTLGCILLLSALNAIYRDILMILDVVLTAWFFMTPVFYSLELFGNSRTISGITFNPAQVLRWINPMASIIDAYRTVLWGTSGSNGPVDMNPIYLLRTLITAVIVFIIGYAVFLRLEDSFGEKL